MSATIIAAGGLGLAGVFLLWRLASAHRKIGKLETRLRMENDEHEAAIKAYREELQLLAERIRDLGGEPPRRGVRIDPDSGVIRRA